MTLAEFITANGITMTSRQVARNVHMQDSNGMSHYRCTLRCDGRKMAVTFSKGAGHKGAEPTLAEVLDCLAMDAAGVENSSTFPAWAAEYGYDEDSRKAERTFNACVKQAADLKALLGQSEYDALLFSVDRD